MKWAIADTSFSTSLVIWLGAAVVSMERESPAPTYTIYMLWELEFISKRRHYCH